MVYYNQWILSGSNVKGGVGRDMGPPNEGKDYKWYISGIFPANWVIFFATDPTLYVGTWKIHWG